MFLPSPIPPILSQCKTSDHAVIGAFAESAMPGHAEDAYTLKGARPNTPEA